MKRIWYRWRWRAPQTPPLRKIYDEGEAACARGLPITACPEQYLDGSFAQETWEDGWNDRNERPKAKDRNLI